MLVQDLCLVPALVTAVNDVNHRGRTKQLPCVKPVCCGRQGVLVVPR